MTESCDDLQGTQLALMAFCQVLAHKPQHIPLKLKSMLRLKQSTNLEYQVTDLLTINQNESSTAAGVLLIAKSEVSSPLRLSTEVLTPILAPLVMDQKPTPPSM